jgi:hypothetical protein
MGQRLAGGVVLFFLVASIATFAQVISTAANTWARTIGDYEGRSGFRELFLELYKKSALPDATPLGAVASTDKTEVVSAPAYLEVFTRMAHGVRKILPCE